MLDPRTRLALLTFARKQVGRLPETWDHRLREVGKIAINYRGARSSALRGLRYALLKRQSGLLLAPFGNAQLLVDTADRELGRVVFIRGDYERLYMEAALDYLDKLGRPCIGKTFIDVGANIGTSTVDALMNFGFGDAVCFEPDLRNFKLLNLNLTLNDLNGRSRAFPIALSDEDGTALLERSPTNFGDTRISETSTADSGKVENWVKRRSLDSMVRDGSLSPGDVGLLWIDTQGHEALVLEGAKTLLEQGVPIVLEYWPEGLQNNGSLDTLDSTLRANYRSAVDLRLLCHGILDGAVFETSNLAAVRDRLLDGDHTDLLLIP